MGFLSPDSVCHSFDERANGYARGEGVIALVMKPVARAIEDNDMIRAVIRSTGSNQDGKTPGITHPSASSQEALIRSVHKRAGLDLASTRYVEAHGEWAQTQMWSNQVVLTMSQEPARQSAIRSRCEQSIRLLTLIERADPHFSCV
jgi:hypothetical protein